MTRNLYRNAWVGILVLAFAATSYAQIGVGVAISFGPPPLPVYAQPLLPGEGYIWTPGYWAYDYDAGDYYWVPGTWVLAPAVGLLWTPGWWGWGGGGFIFHEGYWGPQVGFYGGINYGYGYFGHGYEGGRWDHERFYYNRSVNNVNVTNIHNVYNTTVINNRSDNRISYNGGNGGVTGRPTPQEEAAARERHVPPVAAQTQHVQAARSEQQLRASVNHGKPPVAATPRPAALKDSAAVPAKQAGGPYNPPPNRAAAQPKPNTENARQANNPKAQQPENNNQTARQENTPARPPQNNSAQNNHAQNARQENNPPRPGNAVHPNDLPPIERSAPSSSNAELNQKYQQQQEQLRAQQQQERQRLQQQQDQEHQQLAQQHTNQAKQQQMEQQHQQQTQNLQQQHTQQQQQLARQQQQQTQARQQPPHSTEPKPPKD